MKSNKIEEYKNMTMEDLEKELENTRSKLFNLRCQQVVGGGSANYCNIRNLRKQIARILTVANKNKKQKAV
ncbi:50S ribosomal protein L29 [Candidatus Poribacteria bacterium]|nr:50S ribosomal protein L29 [Candidatus Poribacteria bacterium]